MTASMLPQRYEKVGRKNKFIRILPDGSLRNEGKDAKMYGKNGSRKGGGVSLLSAIGCCRGASYLPLRAK